MKQNENLDKYGRPFPDPKVHYPQPIVAVDAVVIRKKENMPIEVLMITRKKKGTFQGYFALPGGHLNYNEDPKDGCLRELKEETNLEGITTELLCVKGDPLRDTRGHYISIVYLVTVNPNSSIIAGDDASTAEFYSFKEILKDKSKIAFDHYDILLEACKKLNIPI